MGDLASARTIRRILVVEDNVELLSAVCRALSAAGRAIQGVTTAAQALEALAEGVDLVLLDVRLPDGSGVSIADAASKLQPSPLVVALSGEATPKEAFQLAQLGVIEFVSKPFSIEDVMLVVEFVATTRTRLAPIIKACVGNTDMRDLRDGVRQVMVEQALAIADGNRTVAARLLRVSRQAIQKFIREGRRVGI